MADIVRKTTSLNDPLHVGFVRTYYIDGKEVYTETLDKNLDIEKHTGTMPDGTVKEFFENGKVYFECEFKRGQRNGGQNTPAQRCGLRGVRGDFQQAAKRLALLLRRLDAPVFPMGDRLARNAHGLRHLLLRQLFFLSRGGDPLCKRRHIERSPLHLF